MEPHRGPPTATTVAGFVLVAVAIVSVAVVARGTPEVPGARLVASEHVATAMGTVGLTCEALDGGIARASFSSDERACLVDWSAAAVRGGKAVVVIDIWKDAATRDRWMASPVEVGTAAVAGPTWLFRCEFRSICALFQTRAGGLMVLPQPGDDFEILDHRYYEKPFPPSVEEGITGHFPPTDDG